MSERNDASAPVTEATAVEARAAQAAEQGYIGSRTDDTPAAHYTVAGVNEGLPVPSAHDRATISLREVQS